MISRNFTRGRTYTKLILGISVLRIFVFVRARELIGNERIIPRVNRDNNFEIKMQLFVFRKWIETTELEFEGKKVGLIEEINMSDGVRARYCASGNLVACSAGGGVKTFLILGSLAFTWRSCGGRSLLD